jgi:hypothetical protein
LGFLDDGFFVVTVWLRALVYLWLFVFIFLDSSKVQGDVIFYLGIIKLFADIIQRGLGNKNCHWKLCKNKSFEDGRAFGYYGTLTVIPSQSPEQTFHLAPIRTPGVRRHHTHFLTRVSLNTTTL